MDTKHLALLAHPSPDLYGSDRVMLESVSALVADGWGVCVTLPHAGPLVALVEQRGGSVRLCDTPVLRKSILTPIGFVKFICSLVRGSVAGLRLIRSVDPAVIYVNSLTIPLWIVLGRAMGRPVVSHVHEAESSTPALVRRLLNAPQLLATTIIANSCFSIEVLGQSFPRLGRASVLVPNAVAGPDVRPKGARHQLTEPVRIVYVGRLSERKGVDVLVDAVDTLRGMGLDSHLEIVGSVFAGYEWYERFLRDKIKSLDLERQVSLMGFHSDVWPLVARADIVVVPSRFDESFGNTAVEAALAARPLVVSDTSGLREAAAGFSAAIFVEPGDPKQIADAVAAIRARWAEYQDAALQDAEVARGRHGLDEYRERIARVVDSTASSRRSIRPRRRSSRNSARQEDLPTATSRRYVDGMVVPKFPGSHIATP